MNKLIKRREIPVGEAVSEAPLLDRLYRARHIKNSQELDRTLKCMLNPNKLHGIERAVELLLEAYRQQQKIIIVGDFDADGATSTALTVLALRQLGFNDVDYLLPNRFEQGYGLSIPVAEMALEKGVQLLMTVDNGVSSFDGIAFLKEKGVRVLVTDHHLPPDTFKRLRFSVEILSRRGGGILFNVGGARRISQFRDFQRRNAT